MKWKMIEEPCLNTQIGTCPACHEPIMDNDVWLYGKDYAGYMIHWSCFFHE